MGIKNQMEPHGRLLMASELVKELQHHINEQGDMPVHIGYGGERAEAASMAVIHGRPKSCIAILDAATTDLIYQMDQDKGEVNA